MRAVDKVSCPYTFGQLKDPDSRAWCARVSGGHCKIKNCPWKQDDEKKKAGRKQVEQKKLW